VGDLLALSDSQHNSFPAPNREVGAFFYTQNLSKPGLKTCAKNPQIVKKNAGRLQNEYILHRSCLYKPAVVDAEDAKKLLLLGRLTLSAKLFLNLSNYC
jgi:hypothetical protein